jgi:formate hydrogenlyase subunit 6/NADH:ubiquinone oxidoreductase subunit I
VGIPGPLKRMLRGALTCRPEIDPELCTLCGECAKICPPNAITMDAAERQHPRIDRPKCIRCFCCQEVCPAKAITVQPGWLLRLGLPFGK